MKALKLIKWRPALGVLAVGVFACGFALHGAPPNKPHDAGGGVTGKAADAKFRTGEQVRVEQVPLSTPVTAYSSQTVLAREGGRTPVLLAPTRDEPMGGIAAPRTGGPIGCELDEECDPCDPCKVGECIAEVCVDRFADECDSCDDGLFCNGVERCDGFGICVDQDSQVHHVCVEGEKDGQGCDPLVPEDCPDGTCTMKKMDADPCARLPDYICDEEAESLGASGACMLPCTSDSECDDDSYCTGGEICDEQECVGGSNPGDPCTFIGGECLDDGYCGGVCRPDPENPPPCGQGAPCKDLTPTTGTCGWGRCCEGPDNGEWVCERKKKADCDSPKYWLGVGDDPATDEDDGDCDILDVGGEDFNCPKYESAIVDGSVLTGEVLGPAGVAECRVLHEIGDDYELSNCDPEDPDEPWFQVNTFRYIGGHLEGTGERMRVTFYDSQGRFIEDVITIQFVEAGIRRRTVIFSEQPIVPCTGYVSLKPAVTFTPDNLCEWVYADPSSLHGGENDLDVLWINGAPSDAYGTAGSRILAFEIVGVKAAKPTGACCSRETGVCFQELPWVCEEQGGFFQGPGTSCNVCYDHPMVPCNDNTDCKLCIGGDNHGVICVEDADCEPGGVCNTNPQCVWVPPACQRTACCDPDGSCTEIEGGGLCSISGAPCLNDLECPEGQTCEAPCPFGTYSAGFGTRCVPNCCEQPVYMGGDTCLEAEALVEIINVPVPGEDPITITFTDNNKRATFGDYSDGTCDNGIFNPDGGTLDRGWWHSFSLDSASDCTDIRLDLCCTQPIHQPQWAFLYSECEPCGGGMNNTIANWPIGNGISSNDRGMPFCLDADNLWQTFTRLRNGVYYHPIYTATGGHFGEYQFHITALSCAVAACCLPDGSCELFNELDCDEAGGYWLGFGDIPLDVDPVVTCAFGACDLGSCCKGPVCEDASSDLVECDRTQPATCMDSALCETIDGVYVGGAMCDWPAKPCPACEIGGTDNCQLADPNIAVMQHTCDLNTPPTGTAAADDFIPQGDTLSQLCVFGSYLDASGPGQAGPEGYEQFNCDFTVSEGTDSFRVRVYADSVEDPGQPGALVGEAFADGTDVARSPVPLFLETWAGITGYGFGVTLDPPISGMESGKTYWLEVVSDRNSCPGLAGGERGNCGDPLQPGADRYCEGGGRHGKVCNPKLICYWHWTQVIMDGVGNSYSVVGTDDRADANFAIGSGYVPGSGKAPDLAFCLGGTGGGPLNFSAPDAPTGSCCDCTDTCTDNVTLVDCQDDFEGVWRRGWDCSNPLACFAEGDDCAGGGVVVARAGELECVATGGEFGALEVFDGVTGFDTSCYTTDGPLFPHGGNTDALGKDIWFAYTATCTGELTASMCMAGNYYGGYDSYMAIYHDYDHPDECTCPGSSTANQVAESDEGCNGIADGGAGIISALVFPDECWLVRLGGWGNGSDANTDGGRGMVDIACVRSPCEYKPVMPLPDVLTIEGEPFINQKMRYLSFEIDQAEAGLQQGIRVTMINLPAPYETWNGTVMFVGPPKTYCENSGVKLPPCPPAQPTTDFKASTLECLLPTVGNGMIRDWAAEGLVHVYHEGIIPGGMYYIEAADSSCPMISEASWTAPLVAPTSIWGDLVKDCATCPCTPPDGVTGIPTDVTAVLDKFKNLEPPDVGCAPVTKARADHDWAIVNQLINISDVTCCLDAFRGWSYPPPAFADPNPPPRSPNGECNLVGK